MKVLDRFILDVKVGIKVHFDLSLKMCKNRGLYDSKKVKKWTENTKKAH